MNLDDQLHVLFEESIVVLQVLKGLYRAASYHKTALPLLLLTIRIRVTRACGCHRFALASVALRDAGGLASGVDLDLKGLHLVLVVARATIAVPH